MAWVEEPPIQLQVGPTVRIGYHWESTELNYSMTLLSITLHFYQILNSYWKYIHVTSEIILFEMYVFMFGN